MELLEQSAQSARDKAQSGRSDLAVQEVTNTLRKLKARSPNSHYTAQLQREYLDDVTKQNDELMKLGFSPIEIKQDGIHIKAERLGAYSELEWTSLLKEHPKTQFQLGAQRDGFKLGDERSGLRFENHYPAPKIAEEDFWDGNAYFDFRGQQVLIQFHVSDSFANGSRQRAILRNNPGPVTDAAGTLYKNEDEATIILDTIRVDGRDQSAPPGWIIRLRKLGGSR